MKLLVFTLISCLMSISCQKGLVSESFAKNPPQAPSTWPLESMFKAPEYKVVFEKDGVQGVIYEGLNYQGVKQDVFAYYASPTTLGKAVGTEGRTYPAVVCVHGGGGQAFKDWVKIWADKGYAAISMDLEGNGENKVHMANGFKAPSSYFTADEDINSDWFYQAVADVVIAHSLIRSFKEVDSTRTAINGISWGGIISSLVAGLDPRFKVAVPVYGCGYLYEAGAMAPQIKAESQLTQQRWKDVYDPSLYAYKAKMPVLFVNGTNDPCFFLDQWSKTYSLVPNRTISLRYGLEHGHSQGWWPPEIYQFVSNVLISKDEYPVPDLSNLTFQKNSVKGKVEIPASYTKMFLNYTCDSNPELDKRVWKKIPVEFDAQSDKINIDVDAACTMCAVAVEDSEGNHFSSPLLLKNY